MFWGLLVAVVSALLLHTRGGLLVNGFTDPKIIAMTSGIVAAWYWMDGRTNKPRLVHAATAYVAGIIPSFLASKNYMLSIFGYPGVYSGGILTTGLCASGAILADRLDEKRKETVRKVILSCGTMIAILLVAQKMGRDPFRFPTPGGNATGIYGSIIDSGALMVTMLSASFNPLYLAGIWATGTRGAWLGAIVSAFPIRFRAYAFIAATISGIAYTSIGGGDSDADRRAIWSRATSNISFIGTGPATFHLFGGDAIKITRTVSAHNSVLEAASTRGIFGLLGLLAILVAPQMAGLWTMCMFQPISFEVVFIACVLVGISRKEDCHA